MKLFITRHQTKVLLGGVRFELKVRTELTSEEAELVKFYKADKRAIVLNLTIGNLMCGQTFNSSDIAQILETEKNVKESCEAFRNYLEVMRNFGGEEVIEYK